MPASLKPWEIHPSLRAERLQVVAGVISDVRAQAVLEYRPEAGDIPWNLGCTVYARTLYGITQASMSREHGGWLSIVNQTGLHFVFGIGGVPLRFYKSDEDSEVPTRTLRRFYPELEAQQEAFAFDSGTDSERFMRLAVETDSNGLVSRVVFVQVDGSGAIYNPWPIPLSGSAATLTIPTRREGVVLPPPVVGGIRTVDVGRAAQT